MESKTDCGEKCPRYERPETIYIKIYYSATENFGGTIFDLK
jgi:hypothetical protein